MHDEIENVLDKKPEFDHLIKLLDDEDENIYSNVRERFLLYGDDTTGFLKQYLNDENYIIKKRAAEIISTINFDNIETKLKQISNRGSKNLLEEALLLIGTFGYPDLDPEIYRTIFDKMAQDIEEELLQINNNIKDILPLEILNTVNNYLFFNKGFKGNSGNYYNPDNSYINKVIDSRTGIPITLSIIYILIARRLKLPISGINLPGHFILKYEDKKDQFFIDPFNKGVVISMKEASEFIKKIGMAKEEFDKIPYLKKTGDKEIVLRVLRNLIEIYRKENETIKIEQLERLMLCMA
ncbi:MAG: transglutaminase-like domain-containing protein [Ignavibacteria bacterium]